MFVIFLQIAFKINLSKIILYLHVCASLVHGQWRIFPGIAILLRDSHTNDYFVETGSPKIPLSLSAGLF